MDCDQIDKLLKNNLITRNVYRGCFDVENCVKILSHFVNNQYLLRQPLLGWGNQKYPFWVAATRNVHFWFDTTTSCCGNQLAQCHPCCRKKLNLGINFGLRQPTRVEATSWVCDNWLFLCCRNTTGKAHGVLSLQLDRTCFSLTKTIMVSHRLPYF